MKPLLKSAVSNQKKAQMAIEYGASAIGLVGKMPSGPGSIDDELIQKMAASVPPLIATFLLTSETTGKVILDHHRKTQTNIIQIVDTPVSGTHEYLLKHIPNVKRV